MFGGCANWCLHALILSLSFYDIDIAKESAFDPERTLELGEYDPSGTTILAILAMAEFHHYGYCTAIIN